MWYIGLRRAYSSAAERAAHNRLVAGSNPAGPTSDSSKRETRYGSGGIRGGVTVTRSPRRTASVGLRIAASGIYGVGQAYAIL